MKYNYHTAFLLIQAVLVLSLISSPAAARLNTDIPDPIAFTSNDVQANRQTNTDVAAVPVGNFGVKTAGLDIIFPNSHYYQVQRAGNLSSVFEGHANPAVPQRVTPGFYHIINLTTGVRVNRVRITEPVAASISDDNSAIGIDGLQVTFPNSDYYQVQLKNTLETVFEGNADPTVPLVLRPGIYNIINLTTRNRLDAVQIGGRLSGGGGGGSNPTPAPQPALAPTAGAGRLSCALTNSSFNINYGNPVQFGEGPFIVIMKWANTDGSFPGFPMGTDLQAVDGAGAPAGNMRFLGNIGDRNHPKSVYRWTVDASGPDTPVAFSYGELGGGTQCTFAGRTRLVGQTGPKAQTQTVKSHVAPALPIAAPSVDAPASPVNSSEHPDIERLQRTEGVLAFPGALGFGRNAIGGRSGRVLTVNTVRNIVNPNDNLLSLREAIEVEKGPRTVVFSVGGVFDTGRETLNILRKGNNSGSYLTVACQSAPSPGVVIKTYGFNVQHGAHDLVFRHCAVRGIDLNAGNAANAGRGMTIRGGSKNIILDHMSFSWATDEGFQVYIDAKQRQGTDNITLSNSIIAEGDADSSHTESKEHFAWGYHAMGPGCNNNSRRVKPEHCSIVNNYIAHNSSRNGMIWGGTGEISNNVVYNWFGTGVSAQPQYGTGVEVIANNNLMKSGPSTEGSASYPNCGERNYHCALLLKASAGNMLSKYSIGNNYFVPQSQTVADAQLMSTHPNAVTPAGLPGFQPATPSPESILSMAAPGSRFMKCVGASKPSRDAIDSRVISEFYKGTGAIGIGENVRIGGRHNITKQRTFELYEAPTSHPANHDKDKDGMADVWEINYGLNDSDPSDHSGDKDGDGYTNIEEYLAIAALCQ